MLSLTLGELLKYDVIRKAYPDRERGQGYISNPNVMEVISNVLRTRERQLGQMIQAATGLLDSLLTMQALDIVAI